MTGHGRAHPETSGRRWTPRAAVLPVVAFVLSCSSDPGELGVYAPVSSARAADGGAGGATAGAGGVAAAAGGQIAQPPALPVYDPNVHFVWPETAPQEGACLPGVYEGEFTCVLNGGFLLLPISGPVQFTLGQSSGGELLEITEGTLQGRSGTIDFSSDLTGRLECGKNHFHAVATEGTFGTPPISGTFAGSLDGTLDRPTQTLSGFWSLSPAGAPPCEGVWDARRLP